MGDIYTRGGDSGSTSLPDASRVNKNDARVELLGALDEANCFIGFARPSVIDSELDDVLEFVQQRLFNCGAAVSPSTAAGDPPICTEDVLSLERAIDRYAKRAGGFEGFVLPGCDESSARLHVARAVTRRAEREAVAANAVQPLDPQVLAFLNRTGDFLYVAARYLGAGNECRWRPDHPRP